MDNRPIGVFDSGIGGLTVVNAIVDILPNEDILYVGDTARVPYGNKSRERIQQFSLEIAEWLISQDCKMIVIACNTASSLALDYLKKSLPIPVIGVINPGVNNALAATKNYNIGVLGTTATIASDAYGLQLHSSSSNIKVISQACPLFVHLVEEGWISGNVPMNIAKKYLKPIRESKVDTVILGCTHYPLLKEIISNAIGSRVTLIDSGEAAALIIKFEVIDNNFSASDKKGIVRCFVTDDPKSFETLVTRFIKIGIHSTQRLEHF